VTTQLLAWLIDATFATSLATVAIVLLRRQLQRWLGAQIAYRLWIAVPLAAVAACFPLPQAGPAAQLAAQTATAAAPAVVVQVTQTLRSLDADRWLLAVWLLGAFALVLVFAWQQRRFVARLRLREGGDGSWRSATDDASPAVLGVLRQRLVLPERFETEYSADEQRLVLAHERMHQRRRDPWALAACAALRTLFWFNPLVHVAARCFRRDVELACDAAVLRAHPGSIRRYADALLKTHLAGHDLPVGCLWNETPPMKERIMLLKHALPARRTRLAGAILVAFAALGATGLALAGHERATATAGALAAATAPAANAPAYRVRLAMSVDGKPVGHPVVVTRAGETAMVKLDENGVAWGFRFHVDPEHASSVKLVGDVFTRDEQHVIGRPSLGTTIGTPAVIELNDRANPGPVYRIEATVTAAPAGSSRSSMSNAPPASGTPAPGTRLEVRIVTGGPGESTDETAPDAGTPAPGTRKEIRIVKGGPAELAEADRAYGEGDDEGPGDAAMPGAHRDVRETRQCSPPDAKGHKKCTVTREVRVTGPGEPAPMAPLPPSPPDAGTPAPDVPRTPAALPRPPRVAHVAPPAPPAGVPRTPRPAPPAPPAAPAPVAFALPAAPTPPPTPPARIGRTPPAAPPAPPLPPRVLAAAPRAPRAAPPALPAPPTAPTPPPELPQRTPATPEAATPSAAPEPPRNE